VLTYGGQAAFGVTTDFSAVPEAADFAAAVVDEVGLMGPTPPHALTRRPRMRARSRPERSGHVEPRRDPA